MQLLVLHPPGLGLQPRGIQFRLERSDASSIIRGPTGLIEHPACTHTDKLPVRTDRPPITRTLSTTPKRSHLDNDDPSASSPSPTTLVRDACKTVSACLRGAVWHNA